MIGFIIKKKVSRYRKMMRLGCVLGSKIIWDSKNDELYGGHDVISSSSYLLVNVCIVYENK